MKTKTILILGALAGAAVVVAAIASRWDRAETPADKPAASAKPFFEDLAPKLKDVAAIQIKHADKEFTIRKAGDAWQIAEKGGYPAKTDDVKKALFQLGQLRKAEERTSKPALYAELGVQDPDGQPVKEGQTGPTLVTLKDDKDQALATAIVGNVKYGTTPGVFVRKPGEAASWLASGQLDLPGEAARWLDTKIIELKADRIKNATATQPGGETVRVSRAKPADKFAVADVPAGKSLKSDGYDNGMSGVLGYLSFDDVAPADQIDFEGKKGGTPGAYCEFRTFDGLMIAAQFTQQNGKTWGRFSAYSEAQPAAPVPSAAPTGATGGGTPAPTGQPGEAPKPEAAPGATGATGATATGATGAAGATGTTGATGDAPATAAPPAPETKPPGKSPDDIKKEADELNARLGPWAFQIPDWKMSAFNTKMTDMFKDTPPAPPPSLGPGNSAPQAPGPLPPPAPPK
jgi:Domain of unknown function (DUF4340)